MRFQINTGVKVRDIGSQSKLNPVTLEDIEACLSNSERLSADSGKTSEPTRAALMELAIEEIANGWMLFLQFMKE